MSSDTPKGKYHVADSYMLDVRLTTTTTRLENACAMLTLCYIVKYV